MIANRGAGFGGNSSAVAHQHVEIAPVGVLRDSAGESRFAADDDSPVNTFLVPWLAFQSITILCSGFGFDRSDFWYFLERCSFCHF